MIFHGSPHELMSSIEAIGASFAVYEYNYQSNHFHLIVCNSLYEDLLGRPKETAMGKQLDHLFPRYVVDGMLASFNQCKSSQMAVETEILVEYKGEENWWRSVVSPIVDADKAKLRVIQTCVEITEKKKLEDQLKVSMKRFEAVVQSAYDGIITIDETDKIKLMNSAAKHIFGYGNTDVLGMSLSKLIPQQYRKKHVEYLAGFKTSKVDSRPMQSRASVTGLRRDGSEFPVEVTISKIQVEGNTEMTAVIRDISEKNKLIEELVIASQEDALTKLSNRRHFTKVLVQEISRSHRYNRKFCLMMVDIDHFKSINDTYGHDCGDKVLITIAEWLRSNCRETDTVSRWGGEEFLVLLPESSIEAGRAIAEKVLFAVRDNQLTYKGNDVAITVSIGVKSFDCCEETLEETVDLVDKLLYLAKQNGRNRIESSE